MQQVEKATVHFVTSNIRREFVIGETGMYRKEIPEIPAEAIREAVANALCHRDYTTSTVIVLERPRSQVNNRTNSATSNAADTVTDSAPFEGLNETEKAAVQIARDAGRITKKELMEQVGVGKMKATETLKRLAERGLLEWVGSSRHDPKQYYRAGSGK